MTDSAILEAIRERFDVQVATPNSLRVIYDNAPEPAAIVSSWCRFSVQVDSATQISMGQVRYRLTGSATAILFCPIAKGDGAVLTLADAVIAAFRGVSIASPDITFAPAPSVIGTADRDEAWCKRTVRIPFRADTVQA